jgi:lipid-A-disaccharide synthase
MKLFLSAGEPSGDLHGGNLIRAILSSRPTTEIIGFGGPTMVAAGARLLFPLTELAVMGLRRIVRHLPAFFRLADDAERCLRVERPDAVVLIDYPGFNFVLAKRAHALKIPVYYFVPPQLWAWRRGRVRQVRKWCAGVLSALPFEDHWFRSRGVATHYVGHPYFDELLNQKLDNGFLQEQRHKNGRIVALLPGSRNQEVAANFSMMLAAAAKISLRSPTTRFLVAAFNEQHARTVREMIAACANPELPIEVHSGRTPEIIALAEACVAVSGSVSLEIMYRAKPAVIVYRMKPFSLWLARQLVKSPYFTLVNLLAGEELFPEIATAGDESAQICERVLNWLENPSTQNQLVSKLQNLRGRVAEPGACERAAAFLIKAVESRQQLPRAA